MGVQGKKTFTTEDYAFCQRWRDIGGQLWVDPDIDFKLHVAFHCRVFQRLSSASSPGAADKVRRYEDVSGSYWGGRWSS